MKRFVILLISILSLTFTSNAQFNMAGVFSTGRNAYIQDTSSGSGLIELIPGGFTCLQKVDSTIAVSSTPTRMKVWKSVRGVGIVNRDSGFVIQAGYEGIYQLSLGGDIKFKQLIVGDSMLVSIAFYKNGVIDSLGKCQVAFEKTVSGAVQSKGISIESTMALAKNDIVTIKIWDDWNKTKIFRYNLTWIANRIYR